MTSANRVTIDHRVTGVNIRATVRDDMVASAVAALDLFERDTVIGGASIDLGWAPIRLREVEDGLIAVAPNFRSMFPRRRVSEDLTDALWIRAMQDDFHERSGLPLGPPTNFDNSIYQIEGAWQADTVCIRCEELDGSPFSGWLVDVAVPPQPASDVDAGDIAKAYTVFLERPALLATLNLPPGFVVVADKSVVLAVHDESGRVAYDGLSPIPPFPDRPTRGSNVTDPHPNDRLSAVAEELFAQLAPDAELRTIPLEDGAGVCVVHTVRGGGKIYVAPDESVLFVGSAMDFDAGLAAFRAGTRTPPEKSLRPKS
ncbi:hypothetical protein LQ938_11970 [Microbacterium sp. cx-55]|uniref:hypothetical protein n=1 Tax=Microbacterium sp. cx-55 TaxID=2875948 RepID=UPI001CBB883E|nr:hypothetical protein [Microbacterium sp. cx-55]MBZ4488013.1 hypothetical protein [Microbacterium sp. cx-55]UGB34581.1 hypothetical protein LQ938_11970 [Microbacterium sp. cx-55]